MCVCVSMRFIEQSLSRKEEKKEILFSDPKINTTTTNHRNKIKSEFLSSRSFVDQ